MTVILVTDRNRSTQTLATINYLLGRAKMSTITPEELVNFKKWSTALHEFVHVGHFFANPQYYIAHSQKKAQFKALVEKQRQSGTPPPGLSKLDESTRQLMMAVFTGTTLMEGIANFVVAKACTFKAPAFVYYTCMNCVPPAKHLPFLSPQEILNWRTNVTAHRNIHGQINEEKQILLGVEWMESLEKRLGGDTKAAVKLAVDTSPASPDEINNPNLFFLRIGI